MSPAPEMPKNNLPMAPFGSSRTATGSSASESRQVRTCWRRTSVSLRQTRIHTEDCADCETHSGKVDYIERTIELSGDLDDEQRAKLTEIAEKCPVHRTLRKETIIDTFAG